MILAQTLAINLPGLAGQRFAFGKAPARVFQATQVVVERGGEGMQPLRRRR